MAKLQNCSEQIMIVTNTINDYFSKDNGGISLVEYTEKNILVLSVTGSCSKCRKNNFYLKCVIKEMFNEVVHGEIEDVRYV